MSIGDALELSLDMIDELSDKEGCTVLLLGRHGFDADSFLFPNKNKNEDGESDPRFVVVKKDEGLINCVRHPALTIHFSTVHKAKGLEADYVVIINAKDDKYGFPNQMIDDPVLRFVLSDMDDYKYAEERRLFYVAITRTRNATFLLEPLLKESVFLTEISLISSGKECCEKIIHKNISKEVIRAPHCPKCKTGRMLRRFGQYGQFAACSNYPICDYTEKVSVIDTAKKCPRCGGFLVKRESVHGEFYGCSNYPRCKYTVNEIEEKKN